MVAWTGGAVYLREAQRGGEGGENIRLLLLLGQFYYARRAQGDLASGDL